MANKPTKPIKVVPPATPTEEELMAKRLAYFAQKREGIAVTILASICRGSGFDFSRMVDHTNEWVDKSVEMTDRLLEKLYPKPEEKK